MDLIGADFYSCTGVMYATHNGFHEIIDLLVSAGADVNKKANYKPI